MRRRQLSSKMSSQHSSQHVGVSSHTSKENIKSLQSSTKPPRAHASIPIVQESKKVVTESELAEKNELEKKVNLYKRMARSFWERWQWELKERKDASMREKILSHQKRNIVVTPMNALQIKLHNINRALLSDPIPQGTVVLGQGSFGIVKLKTFRGMYVAVKELFSRTVLSDVHNEARMLMQVCHPFLPYLFGVSTNQQPYCLVMQFHGMATDDHETRLFSCNINEAIKRNIVTDGHKWLEICAQLMEALRYLHDEAKLLHNDVTIKNVLLANSKIDKLPSSIHAILIDFGKATTVDGGRKYTLTESEKLEYTRRFPHIAPEVIHGLSAQTQWSDVYAAGGVLYHIIDAGVLTRKQAAEVNSLASKCRHSELCKRPSAGKALQALKTVQ